MVNWKICYFENWMHDDGLLILDSVAGLQLQKMRFADSGDVIWEQLSLAQGYQVSSARNELAEQYHVTDSLLKRCPNLLAVSVSGAGYDTVDVAACTEQGVIVVNQAGANKEAVAEHVLGMMLILSKRIIEMDRSLRRDRDWHRNDYMGYELLGKSVGIIGLGNVGSRVAELCRGLLKMSVCAYDPYLSKPEIEARGATPVSLETLLQSSDFVSVNCPLTKETAGMIGADAIGLMKQGSHLLTTARGGIVDEGALVNALAAKSIRGAGIDVWVDEPPAMNHGLIDFDNVILTMHTAGITVEAKQRQGVFAAEQWLEICTGNKPPRVVNPEAWDFFRSRRLKLQPRYLS